MAWGRTPPLPAAFTWLALLIGSYGNTAEMSFPRAGPFNQQPKLPLALVLSCLVLRTPFQAHLLHGACPDHTAHKASVSLTGREVGCA